MSSSCSFTPPLEGWEVRKQDPELIKELSEQFSLSHPAALVMAFTFCCICEIHIMNKRNE